MNFYHANLKIKLMNQKETIIHHLSPDMLGINKINNFIQNRTLNLSLR